MKLEDKFCNSFFYSFLISIILSTLIVSIILGLFTNNNYSKKTMNNIIDLESKNSKMIIKSVNVLLTTSFQKIQASLNEQILYYQKTANNILKLKEEPELNTTFIKSAVNIDLFYCFYDEEDSNNSALWTLDRVTSEDNIDSKKEAKYQLIAISKILSNIDSNIKATLPDVYWYSFYFESNELYIAYPIYGLCYTFEFFNLKYISYRYSTFQCVDENSEYYETFKFKCSIYYKNFQRSKSKLFDNNYSHERNKTIFVSNYYAAFTEYEDKKYTMCIDFDDPITKGKAYSCSQVHDDDLILSLEKLNSKIQGYFLVTIVGFNNVFFFPEGTISPKTITENVYNWNLTYNLDEKSLFYDKIAKIFSSNYIDYIDNSAYDEIYINGKNSSEQYFFMKGKKFLYSIYPVIMENLYGEKEHVFSIIHIYNEQLYLEQMKKYNDSYLIIQIFLQIFIFLLLGLGILYILYLTFNYLSKYIVIPIKNVNYMLKGIHVGGNERLDYLLSLKKKQEENLENYENIFIKKSINNNKLNKINENQNNIFQDNNEKEFQDNSKLINSHKISFKEDIKKYNEFYKKFDEESDYIDKENKFYNFDEQLLQYRPIEIDNLVESLLNLKDSLILTSDDRHINQIIEYSYSENVFKNLKNKEGSIICQSNIGNLQSQLLQFDKAIYHIASSLQDNKLKRFLKRNLSDEFDEGDVLLKQISNSFNRMNKKKKNNKLVEKQINNSVEEFSKKTIGILINIRYCRLIHAYFKFFQKLKKMHKLNEKIIVGQFMNTSFHTITYFHKTIIQYIYLSYFKNDLIKIGESILDYIEFLIKFKFKVSSEDNYLMNNVDDEMSLNFQTKQDFKKQIFDKILKWFNLFDDYISYVKDYSSFASTKTIIDDYKKSLYLENSDFNAESQSASMFILNIQRSEFLKGKFCLYCNSNNDALFYFIRAAKKKSIVIDGLIKKRSLKHIFKLLKHIEKEYEIFDITNKPMKKGMKEYQIYKNNLYNTNIKNRKKTSINLEMWKNNNGTFGQEIEEVKNVIIQDISICNDIHEKDILILIDFNIYNNKEEADIYAKMFKIDSFIEETINILNDYLFKYDRTGVFILSNKYQIICPLMNVGNIDINNISKDLYYYKNISFIQQEEELEYDDDMYLNENIENNSEFNLGYNENITYDSPEDSSEITEEKEIKFNKLSLFVDAINYINNYSKMKEGLKNEKYFIVFSDMLNARFNYEEDMEKLNEIFEKLNGNKNAVFLLVGKRKQINLKNDKDNIIDNLKLIKKLIINKFKAKSEIIDFDDMKKIKTFLSNNNVIKDEIIYPNEIYK